MAADRPTGEKALTRPAPQTFFTPFSLMRRVSDDMERMFEDTWTARKLPHLFRRFDAAQLQWSPDIEVFERKGEFVVRADLPGMTKENVKVEISDGELLVQGERKEEKEQKENTSNFQRRGSRDCHPSRKAAGEARASARD